MIGRRGAVLLLGLAVLLGGVASAARAARSDTVEVRGRAGVVGRLTRVVVDDGGSYVIADKLAAVLKGTWNIKGTRATLTVGKRSAQFTRNQSRVVVDGQLVVLDAAARTAAAGWLRPEDI